MEETMELPACPVETTLLLIGDKWKVLILRDLMSGTKRFGELKKSIGHVSQKVLTAQLRDMEAKGLVSCLTAEADHLKVLVHSDDGDARARDQLLIEILFACRTEVQPLLFDQHDVDDAHLGISLCIHAGKCHIFDRTKYLQTLL